MISAGFQLATVALKMASLRVFLLRCVIILLLTTTIFHLFVHIYDYYDPVRRKLSGNSKAITRFVYLPPPKTGSMVTRAELRRFCVANKLKCLGQSWPCPKIQDCVLTEPAVHDQLDQIFWAAFTVSRLRTCCPAALNARQFDANLFHLYLADNNTKQFYNQTMRAASSFTFTFLRDPIDQFVSFFHFVTKSHSRIYGRYLEIVAKRPKLEPVVHIFYEHAKSGSLQKMDDDLRQLYHTLQNIQSRVLGWDGTQMGLRSLIDDLERFSFICPAERLPECWRLLHQRLHWPRSYFNPAKLRVKNTTRYPLRRQLRAEIAYIQYADGLLYERAHEIFEKKFRSGGATRLG